MTMRRTDSTKKQRQAMLASLEIMDSLPEQEFDEIASLVAKNCGVRIALICFFDGNHVRVKSKYGTTNQETLRDFSFCARTILHDDLIILENSTEYYAGIPIHDPQFKFSIGCLCVVHDEPFQINEIQKASLLNLRNRVEKLLELQLEMTTQKNVQFLLEQGQRISKMGSWDFDLHTEKMNWSIGMFDLFPGDFRDQFRTIELHTSTIHPLDLPRWLTIFENCKKDGAYFSLRFRRLLGGREIWIESHGEGLKNSTGTIFKIIGTCQDVTDKVNHETMTEHDHIRSVQDEKMSLVGEMSVEILHEINNPVSILSAQIQTLAVTQYGKEKFHEKLRIMRNSIDRINRIIDCVKRFSRKTEPEKFQEFSLNIIIKDSITLAQLTRRTTRIKIQFETNGQDCLIDCNQVELQQVFINLISNASDAVSNLVEPWIRIETYVQGKTYNVRILDSGSGIPLEIESKIFQRFFTTKEIGHGTGLGLSISQEILHRHHAQITINRSYVNTCFEICFLEPRFLNRVA